MTQPFIDRIRNSANPIREEEPAEIQCWNRQAWAVSDALEMLRELYISDLLPEDFCEEAETIFKGLAE